MQLFFSLITLYSLDCTGFSVCVVVLQWETSAIFQPLNMYWPLEAKMGAGNLVVPTEDFLCDMG